MDERARSSASFRPLRFGPVLLLDVDFHGAVSDHVRRVTRCVARHQPNAGRQILAPHQAVQDGQVAKLEIAKERDPAQEGRVGDGRH